MHQATQNTRRKLLEVGIHALVGAAILSSTRLLADEQTIQTVAAEALSGKPWAERRKEIERKWLDLLGDFPAEVPELQVKMKEVAKQEGITRYHVSFQSEPDDRVTAWLLVPDSARAKQPTPAIICIHSTTFGAGKDLTIGLSGRRRVDPPRDLETGDACGLYLAHHGYITLSIDLYSDGERVKPGARLMDTREFYIRHPEWSIVGKNTWDIMRSVDFLKSLDFVDQKHIGIIGKSLGGHTALFAAAFEPRITAAISNGGVLDWHRKVSHWGRSDAVGNSPATIRQTGYDPKTGPYIYIKKFRPYIADQSKPIPVDFDELMMMVAPRPLLILSSEWEYHSHKIAAKCLEAAKVYVNWQDVEGLPSALEARQRRASYAKTLAYYKNRYDFSPERMERDLRKVGAADCFSWFSHPGGHSYPLISRRYTFAWFDRWFGFEPPGK